MVRKAVPTDVLRHTARLLVLLTSTVTMSPSGSAADLRIPIESTATRPTATLSPKTRWQLFEEFLQWKRQQSREAEH
jgi:hypothetical protein